VHPSDKPTRDSVSKKSKSTLPSGLVTNWEQKIAARKPVKATGAATGATSSSIEQTLGGLDDEDAYAVQPDSELLGKSRNKDRKNDVRFFIIQCYSPR
jgi:hypothetical protein